MYKRVTLFAGHYGSGKTNLAVNYALALRAAGKKVSIADLDIVNPYFRTKDSAAELESAGVRLISSQYANSNVDTPALPGEAYSIVDDLSSYAVVDVGGDDRGALALGRYVPNILKENNYDNWLVVNCYRPLSRTVNDLLEIKFEIETACRLPFTGIINNSNLGASTDADAVLSTVDTVNNFAAAAGPPVIATTVERDLYPQLKSKLSDLYPIDLHFKPGWAVF